MQILNFARADLGATDWGGKTALHYVCEYAHENDDARKMAEGLLHRGADVNVSDACGHTPLMLAMENLPLMRLLVALGSKPSTDQAALYVEQCRGDKRREEVLNLLVAEGWCPRFLNTSGDISDVAASSAAAAATAAAHSGVPQPLGSTSPRLSAERSLTEIVGDLIRPSSFSETTNADHLLRAPIAHVASRAHAAADDEGRRPIHLAAASGRVGAVNAFPRVNTGMTKSRDSAGCIHLHSAAEAGHAQAVAARGVVPDLTDCKRLSALNIAVINGCRTAALALLIEGVSPTPPGVSGKTAVHLACEHNAPKMVELLLRFGALPGHCWNDLLQSPLMEGCFAGALDAVKALLPRLSIRQINLRDKIISANQGGTTALLAAITCGKNEIGLVEAVSSSTSPRNVVGLSSIHTWYVASFCRTNTCDRTFQVGRPDSVIYGQAEQHTLGWLALSCCSLILNKVRASHNHEASSACALQRSVTSVTKSSLVELFSCKLSTSRQPRVPSSMRLTSARLAGLENKIPRSFTHNVQQRLVFCPLFPPLLMPLSPPCPVPTIQKLLEAGADPKIRMASTNVSPLEIIASDKEVSTDPTLGPSLVRALTEAGADVNGVGPKGRTALHFACHGSACGEVVQALLNAGADARAPCAGMQFLTPLQLAAHGGNVEALRVLIGRPECRGLNAVGAPPERCGENKGWSGCGCGLRARSDCCQEQYC